VKFIFKKLAKVISGSEVEVYPDDGHTPHISNPKEFVKRTVSFATASS
jgi:pimeloyl-ACP methyl ester carboxylesterase